MREQEWGHVNEDGGKENTKGRRIETRKRTQCNPSLIHTGSPTHTRVREYTDRGSTGTRTHTHTSMLALRCCIRSALVRVYVCVIVRVIVCESGLRL